MANLSGARGTGNITAAQIKPDVDNKLYLLDANKAPLVALTAKLRKKVTTNPKFSWFEQNIESYIDAVNYSTGYTAGSTSIVVDNGSYFSPQDTVKVPSTGEVMRVTAISTNILTVVRGVGETAAGALADNEPLWIIGSAFEEGTTSATANTGLSAEVYNYCQIFKSSIEDTGTMMETDTYTGPDLPEQRRIVGIKHSQKLERAFFFGERAIDTSGTHPRRYTRGLNTFITTNVTDAGGTLTEAEFESFLRSGFRYGSRKKYLFASRLIVSAISSWAQGKLQMFPKDKTYGIAIAQYLSPHGEVLIISHDMLEGAGATNQEYGGYAFLVDLENVMYRPLQNRDTRLKMNVQANDQDGEKDEYITEAGLMVVQEKTHAILKDVLQY
uniref:Phage major capsid protein n=1 Tax=Eiseniibacteriota bacterium TaxID=2212470 RepID=A0A832I0Z0_UNCEI